MNERQAAWLAGILEGEGCFHFNRSPKITVSMTDADIIARIAQLFKSPFKALKLRPGCKQTYRTEVHAKKALTIMAVILPQMGTRRSEKIREVFALAAARRGGAFGERCGSSLVTDEKAAKIKKRYLNRKKSGETGWSIANEFGVCQATVWYIANKRRLANGSRIIPM
jgi:hypothetical protein